MAATKYSYVLADFTGLTEPTPDITALKSETQASAIVTALDYINANEVGPPTDLEVDVWFKDALSAGDQTLLDGVIAAHTGVPLPDKGLAKDNENRLRVSAEPRKEGSALVFVTHNWCDPCTWYSEALRKTGVTLTDSGDGKTFTSEHPNWINLTHGRLYREDLVAAAHPVIVRVQGIKKNERLPFESEGGDYTVNYEEGSVTFAQDQSGKPVTADFSHANGSMYIVGPTAGKRLWVEKSEVQFSNDVDLKDTIHFCPYAYDPQNPPNKIPVAFPTTYKKAQDFVDEANGTYPQVPAFGGTTRGLSVPHLVFPFNYLALKELRSSQGVEIRVWLNNDKPFGGAFATATFYCTSYNDT